MIKNIVSLIVGLLVIVGCESDVVIPADIHAPVANNDSVSVIKTNTIVIEVLKNDTDTDGTINISSVKIITNVSHGKATLNETKGTVTYVSDANFSGNDVFTYRVKDNNGAESNIATVTIEVKEPTSTTVTPTPVPTTPTPVPTNTRPVATNDSKVLTVATSVIINVLENDKALRGTLNPKSVILVQQATQGRAYVSATTGTITYVANNTYIGNDSFKYRMRDSYGTLSNEATVTVNVQKKTENPSITPIPTAVPTPIPNKVPVATNDTVELKNEKQIRMNVLQNDNDSDGSLLLNSIELVTDVSHGALSIDRTTGIITYTPDNTYTGIETFTYKVKDNTGAFSNVATVEINVSSIQLVKSIAIEKKAKEWYIRLVVEDTSNNMKTQGTQLGQLEGDAVVTKHSLKALAPFRPTYLDVVFKNPEGVDAGEYKSNFHTADAEVDSWEFTVKSHDSNATMILSWRGLYVLSPYTDTEGRKQYNEYRSLRNPLIAYMTLVDMQTNKEVKIIENNVIQPYVFQMDGLKERTFKWHIKDSNASLPSASSATVPSEYRAKLQKIEVRVLRKDAIATPDADTQKRVNSLDMLTPPSFEVLVK